MSDDESAPPAESPSPRVRRVSNPRPKKKTARDRKPAAETAAPQESKFPEFPEPAAPPVEYPAEPADESAEEPGAGPDWQEPEAPSAGDASQQAGSKRKRRRKKGKGGQNAAATPGETATPEAQADGSSDASAPRAPRPKLDPEQLSKCAWKIYLAEVSEEGIALIADHDARELSRRCFRLAEIFLEEQARRR